MIQLSETQVLLSLSLQHLLIGKLNEERPDLPLFYVDYSDEHGLLVYLGTRRIVDLSTFVKNFISNKIQFKSVAETSKIQQVDLVFYDMKCWKCGIDVWEEV